MTAPPLHEDKQVSVVVVHLVDPAHKADFESHLKKLMAHAAECRGYLGCEIVHRQKGNLIEYHIFYRFDNFQNYALWNDARAKAEMVEHLHRYTVSSQKHSLSGLETWFALSTDEPMVPPPKYKMALTTWLGVYSLLMIIFLVLGKYLLELNLYLRFLVISMLIVLGMTYFVMPFLTKLLARWLYPKE